MYLRQARWICRRHFPNQNHLFPEAGKGKKKKPKIIFSESVQGNTNGKYLEVLHSGAADADQWPQRHSE
jgi:hypothetical protein